MFPRQACIGAFAWFLLGYGFAYHNGKDGDANAFIGTGPSNFALSGGDYDIDESNGGARPSLPPARALTLKYGTNWNLEPSP